MKHPLHADGRGPHVWTLLVRIGRHRELVDCDPWLERVPEDERERASGGASGEGNDPVPGVAIETWNASCGARLNALIDLCLAAYRYDEDRVEVVMAAARTASRGGTVQAIRAAAKGHDVTSSRWHGE